MVKIEKYNDTSWKKKKNLPEGISDSFADLPDLIKDNKSKVKKNTGGKGKRGLITDKKEKYKTNKYSKDAMDELTGGLNLTGTVRTPTVKTLEPINTPSVEIEPEPIQNTVKTKEEKETENEEIVKQINQIKDKLGEDKVIKETINNEKYAIEYMKKKGIRSHNELLGEIVYHGFRKIVFGKNGKEREIVNTIPWEEAYFVAREHYGADSFVSYNPQNGLISITTTEKNKNNLNKIWEKFKELVPNFPEPVNNTLFSPKDPELMKEIREKLTEGVVLEILEMTNKKPEKPENKTAHINTDEGIEDEDSMIQDSKKTELEKVDSLEMLPQIVKQDLTEYELKALAKKIFLNEPLSPEEEGIREKVGDILEGFIKEISSEEKKKPSKNREDAEKKDELAIKNAIIEKINKQKSEEGVERKDNNQEAIKKLMERKEEIEKRLEEIKDEKFGINTYRKNKNWLQKTWKKIFNF